MVIAKVRKDSYRLRFEHGLIQGSVRTNERAPWTSQNTFDFAVKDDVSEIQQMATVTAARLMTKAKLGH